MTLLTAAKTHEALNQAVVVEDRPSAGGRSPEQSRALVQSEIQQWDDVMWQTGIKIDH